MKILIVDDSASIRSLAVSIVEELGHDVCEAASGEEALKFTSEANCIPDLVILDINMPGIDGYETAKQLKNTAGALHLPIIFLTGDRDPDVQTRCLELGDDYIAKPFSVDMLALKIKAHLRVSRISSKMQQSNLELRRHHQMVRTEHDIVENIFSNHFKRHITQAENFRYHISPASVFNGDVLLTAAGPVGNFYIAVGDVTGHGLPAAVGAIPIYPAFRTMAHKGLNIGSIASEMNRALRELMPDNMMMAITLLELNAAGDELTVWSGGMPAMIIADAKGNIAQLIESQHPPLAALEELEFKQDVRLYKVQPGDRVYLFTDGVEESRNQQQEMFGEDRLKAAFDGGGDDKFNRIISELESFTGGVEQDDDITLAELVCQANVDYERTANSEGLNAPLIPWQLSVTLGPDDMRQAEPVPQIVRLLGNATGLNVHEDFISTILSEFYGNALEHGLLELDSSIKDEEDGFFTYYQLRRERLAELKTGEINIKLDFSPRNNGVITLTVSDSGKGFQQGPQQSDEEQSFGRGINIVRHLCESVEYSDGGSTVTAIYHIGAGR